MARETELEDRFLVMKIVNQDHTGEKDKTNTSQQKNAEGLGVPSRYPPTLIRQKPTASQQPLPEGIPPETARRDIVEDMSNSEDANGDEKKGHRRQSELVIGLIPIPPVGQFVGTLLGGHFAFARVTAGVQHDWLVQPGDHLHGHVHVGWW